MSVNGDFEALFVNDPDKDYALTMEISHKDEIFAIVRQHEGTLVLEVYPPSKTLRIPLNWLMERLQTAEAELSKEGTQADNQSND